MVIIIIITSASLSSVYLNIIRRLWFGEKLFVKFVHVLADELSVVVVVAAVVPLQLLADSPSLLCNNMAFAPEVPFFSHTIIVGRTCGC